jgi:primosomal protein N' (replication factor Y)
MSSDVPIDDGTAAVPTYAEVAVPLHISRTFLYKLNETEFNADVGVRILVPLGNTQVIGFVVALHETLPPALSSTEIKDAGRVIDAVPICTPEILELTRWVSEYYASPWGEVIKAALPPGISPSIHEFVALTEQGLSEAQQESPAENLTTRILTQLAEAGPARRDSLLHLASESQLAKTLRTMDQAGLVERTRVESSSFVKTKLVRFVQLVDDSNRAGLLTPPAGEAACAPNEEVKLTELQQRIVDSLRETGAVPLPQLLKNLKISSSTVNTLVKKGVVIVTSEAVRRDPFYGPAASSARQYKLTVTQQAALNEIELKIRAGSYAPFLLHGVTGSGKTEVYIRAMRTALDQGKSSLMLVPEIALTPVFSRRLREHFGDQVAIFHSSLSKGERFDEWDRVRNGKARIVIGTRSAVFAPIKKLGLIVIDEEHESSYRQQDSPYYNGRDTAIVRAQKESAVVVLGSATPSLETFQNARNGKYSHLSLPERIGARPMARAAIIDMRDVFAVHGKPQVFSDELLTGIRETYERGEQSIILLNRRGYSAYVLCRSCGESVQCPNCDVTLTYHRSERVVICHYCNHRQAVPSACPSCGKKYIYFVGEGTEQLEEILQQRFPTLKIARIDRDTTGNRRRFEKTLQDFSEGKIHALVGTQMLAKGHDFPNVTLVGVVSVDAGLALPDFRAAERTFQLITQVAGRAGRGDRPGKVLIQTYHPDHYALRHACAQDYEAFYKEEIRYRQNHSYPPFIALGSLLVHGPDLNKVRNDAFELRKQFDAVNRDRTVRILGPAPAPLARLKGEHRFQLLIKSSSRKRLREVADAALKLVAERGVNLRTINLEIDPVSMM